MKTARIVVLVAVTLTAGLSAAWVGLGMRQDAAMVRVGGKTNACACTQRIEP